MQDERDNCRGLGQMQSAIYIKANTCCESVPDQERDRVGDLSSLPCSGQRRFPAGSFEHSSGLVGPPPRIDHAGRNRVDPEWRQLARQRRDHAIERPIDGGKPRRARIGQAR